MTFCLSVKELASFIFRPKKSNLLEPLRPWRWR